MHSRVIELRIASVIFALLAALFVAFPEIDLAVSAHFFNAQGGWQGANDSTLGALAYRGLPRLGQLLLVSLTALLLLGTIKRFSRLKTRRAIFGFLLAGALLGPVLLVDYSLKGHFGRARPATVQAFGGDRVFTPAFILADQCKGNCAFVSGHVATAAFIMAFGWLGTPTIRRRWLLSSLAFAGYFAWIRMSAGGHFLSDTIFAWFATYFSLWLTEILFRKFGWLASSAQSSCAQSAIKPTTIRDTDHAARVQQGPADRQ
jgi:membrane-associated phospholipid phosphatase